MSEIILLNDERPAQKRDQDFATIADVKRMIVQSVGEMAKAIVDLDRRVTPLEGASIASAGDVE